VKKIFQCEAFLYLGSEHQDGQCRNHGGNINCGWGCAGEISFNVSDEILGLVVWQ